jgi:hypothetical protein
VAFSNGSVVDRRRLGPEVLVVLGLSLGQSAVYSVLRIVERMTRNVPLAQQTSTLNASVTPDRPWLDLSYQLVGISFGLVPAFLALYLLGLTNRPAGEAIGLDRQRPGFDLGFGALVALGIGVPGLGLYLGARALDLNTQVQASGLTDNWWTVPVLLLSALQNAVLEEVVVIGYLFTRLHQLGWGAVVIIGLSALVPPLPGLRRVRRQPDHGRDLRSGLPALEAGRSAGRRAHPARCRCVRGVRRIGSTG